MSDPDRPLFHGGVPGLRPGALLTGGQSRPIVDGCEICAARAVGKVATIDGHPIDQPTLHPDRIYLTTSRLYAKFYASLYGRGDVYEVIPVGGIIESEEDHFPTWTAAAATVKRIEAVSVLLTPSERARLFRRWSTADHRAEGVA